MSFSQSSSSVFTGADASYGAKARNNIPFLHAVHSFLIIPRRERSRSPNYPYRYVRCHTSPFLSQALFCCADGVGNAVSLAMPPKESGFKRIPDKLTDAEKKKKQQENKAKANPALAEAKKAKNDACRDRRKESGSQKSFS